MRIFKTTNSKDNLCDHCDYTYPECSNPHVVFGEGLRGDNIIECGGFSGDVDLGDAEGVSVVRQAAPYKIKTLDDLSEEASSVDNMSLLLDEVAGLLDQDTVMACDPDIGGVICSYLEWENEEMIKEDLRVPHFLCCLVSADNTVGIVYDNRFMSPGAAVAAMAQVEQKGYQTRRVPSFDIEEELKEAVDEVEEETKDQQILRAQMLGQQEHASRDAALKALEN